MTLQKICSNENFSTTWKNAGERRFGIMHELVSPMPIVRVDLNASERASCLPFMLCSGEGLNCKVSWRLVGIQSSQTNINCRLRGKIAPYLVASGVFTGMRSLALLRFTDPTSG